MLKFKLVDVQQRNISLKECCQNLEAHRQLRKERSNHSPGNLLSLFHLGTMIRFLCHILHKHELAYS